jgi:eukaryotic-like serine/threonine-protein kinase
MSLVPGTRLGVYEITALIGAGGMGEVYRARDAKLNRDVAIKVLPDAFTHDPERLARFTREAHMLASLNHPHIGAIYGIEDSAGARALVLELVEGETLADRIARGRIPFDEAVAIAGEICEALQAAHEQGIIHRDLKPSNIKVTADDAVKVLDFGLAKLAQTDAAAARPDVTLSPTITTPALMTAAGIVMGTAAYMSPEQAKGREADKRSDVWAFGAVLYEMLTGKRAFDGEDMTDVLGAVVRLDPDWQALPSEVPPSVRTLLQQCLVKDRRKRIADIAAARFVLEHQATAASTTAPASVSRRPRWLYPALASLAVTTVAALSVLAFSRPQTVPAPVVRTTIQTSVDTALALSGVWPDVAITPDASRIVYQGTKQLLIRALDQLEATVLSSGAAHNPFISPDGQWVGFFDGSELKKVTITGGPPETVASILGDAVGAAWGPDGTIIFATLDPGAGLMRVPAAGGTPTVLTRLAPDQRDHMWPEWLPGGKAVLYTIYPRTGGLQATQVAVLDVETGASTVLLRGSHAHYVPTGHLVYTVAGTLRAVAFDGQQLKTTGTPAPILDEAATSRLGAASVALAGNGTLVYVPGSGGVRRNVFLVDARGQTHALPGLRPDVYRQIRVSPDGKRLAYAASGDIGVYDFARGEASRMTTPETDTNPLWTPDGKRIVFTSRRPGYIELFWRAADGTGSDERLLTRAKDLTNVFATSWSADGQQLLFTEVQADLASSIGQFTPGSPSSATVLLPGNDFSNARPAISPNGRWIAYESNASGQFEIYVERYPQLGDRKKISTSGGRDPRWSRTGGELFWASEDGQLLAASVPSGTMFEPGPPRVLLDRAMTPILLGDQPYDVTDDGRFVVIRNDTSDAPSIVVVQNWFEELKRLAPTN